MARNYQSLLTGATTNTTGTAVDIYRDVDLQRRFMSVQVYGTFGGATVRIEGSLDGTNYSLLDNGEFTESLIRALEWRGAQIRAAVVTASGTTNVTCLLD